MLQDVLHLRELFAVEFGLVVGIEQVAEGGLDDGFFQVVVHLPLFFRAAPFLLRFGDALPFAEEFFRVAAAQFFVHRVGKHLFAAFLFQPQRVARFDVGRPAGAFALALVEAFGFARHFAQFDEVVTVQGFAQGRRDVGQRAAAPKDFRGGRQVGGARLLLLFLGYVAFAAVEVDKLRAAAGVIREAVVRLLF